MNVEKSHKSVSVCPMKYLQLKGLSLRGNPLRLYRAKRFPLMNWTYGDTGFYSG